MSLLIEVFVNECQYWHHCLNRGRSLVIPQDFIFLQTSVHRLQQGIKNGLIEELSVSTQRAKLRIQENTSKHEAQILLSFITILNHLLHCLK